MGRLGSFSVGLAWIHSLFLHSAGEVVGQEGQPGSLISLAVGTGSWLDCLTSPPDLRSQVELRPEANCHHGGLSIAKGVNEARSLMKTEALKCMQRVIFVVFYWSKCIPRIAQRWRTKNETISSEKDIYTTLARSTCVNTGMRSWFHCSTAFLPADQPYAKFQRPLIYSDYGRGWDSEVQRNLMLCLRPQSW